MPSGFVERRRCNAVDVWRVGLPGALDRARWRLSQVAWRFVMRRMAAWAVYCGAATLAAFTLFETLLETVA